MRRKFFVNLQSQKTSQRVLVLLFFQLWYVSNTIAANGVDVSWEKGGLRSPQQVVPSLSATLKKLSSAQSILCLPKIRVLREEAVNGTIQSHKTFISCEIADEKDEILIPGTYNLKSVSNEIITKIIHRLREDPDEGILLEIPGGKLTMDSLYASDPQRVSIIHRSKMTPRRQRRQTATSGSLKTVVIRISATDSTPTYSAQQLQYYWFDADVSARRQFELCSKNALTLSQSPFGAIKDVAVDSKAGKQSADALCNLAEAKVNSMFQTDSSLSKYGITSIRSWADLLVFIVPPGTGSWVANAVIGGKQSNFNDRYGASLGAIMHELGHNLKLDHGYDNMVEYQDLTGYMGMEDDQLMKPQKCYNGYNHYNLGWFEPYTLSLDASSFAQQVVRIAAFVDFDRIQSNQYVVVNVGDLYVQYNRATRHNKETGELPNKLTVVKKIDRGSNLLGGLGLGDQQSFTTTSSVVVYFKVCDIYVDSTGNVADSMLVAFGREQHLKCSKEQPSSSPTKTPTFKPTSAPTVKPTSEPTPLPTLKPTDKPTPFPTREPTSKPTPFPTREPTSKPTPFPTREPTSKPTPFPTKKPTNKPTTFPTKKPTNKPTTFPTKKPTNKPTTFPTNKPTYNEANSTHEKLTNNQGKNSITENPTNNQTNSTNEKPTNNQTNSTNKKPTNNQTNSTNENPTNNQTNSTNEKPTNNQTNSTNEKPTNSQTNSTNEKPTNNQTNSTNEKPTNNQTNSTTKNPTNNQTNSTTKKPTNNRTNSTTKKPTNNQTSAPKGSTYKASPAPSTKPAHKAPTFIKVGLFEPTDTHSKMPFSSPTSSTIPSSKPSISYKQYPTPTKAGSFKPKHSRTENPTIPSSNIDKTSIFMSVPPNKKPVSQTNSAPTDSSVSKPTNFPTEESHSKVPTNIFTRQTNFPTDNPSMPPIKGHTNIFRQDSNFQPSASQDSSVQPSAGKSPKPSSFSPTEEPPSPHPKVNTYGYWIQAAAAAFVMAGLIAVKNTEQKKLQSFDY